MRVDTLVLWLDEVEVSFGIRGIATNGDWQHDRTLRSQARTIARRLLRDCDTRPGERWSIVLATDGTATVSHVW